MLVLIMITRCMVLHNENTYKSTAYIYLIVVELYNNIHYVNGYVKYGRRHSTLL